MNRIEVNFVPCDPAPARGYNIQFRVAGSGAVYRNAGNFFVSPAVFYDTLNPAGTCYEGYIVTDCSGVFGNPVTWDSCDSDSGTPDPAQVTLTFTVTGGGAGANISAQFSSPIDVDLDIDAVFVDGYTSVDCTGAVDSHLHSTLESILAGNTAYIGNDVSTGGWTGVNSFVFYGIVLSWPGNSSLQVANGDVLIMGSYSVTIIIEGC